MPATTPSRGRALIALLRPDARRWVGLGALVATGSLLLLTGPLVVRQIVDRATEGADTAELVRLAVVFLVIAVVTQVVAVVVARQATIAAWRTTNDLRMRITRHVLGLDHEFHRRHTPGELIQRVDGDVTSVADFLGQVVPKAAGGVMLVGGVLVVLTVLDWRLGVGMAVYLAGAVMVVVAMRHRAVRESSDEMGAYARLYGGIEERLTAAEDLRANGAGVHAMWRFVEDSSGTMQSSVRRERAFLSMWWAVQGSVAAGSVLTLVISATLVGSGVISLGTAFLLFQYVLLVSRPLEELVHELETVQKANGAMVRVAELLAVEPTIVDRGTTSPPPGPLAVRCRGVSFDYGDERTILHDVDVDIAAGRSVGIVGRTGSGKTTFSRLLLRLVEATGGTVSLGGVPIADIPMAELRRRVGAHPAGGRAVRRHDPGERGAVRSWADRRRRRGRVDPGRSRRSGRGRDPSPPRRPGNRSVRWRGPAPGPRPGLAAAARPRRARRGHRPRRSPNRGPPRGRGRPVDGRAHDADHRPPAVDPAARRRGDRVRPRADRRARRPRRARRRRRQPLPSPPRPRPGGGRRRRGTGSASFSGLRSHASATRRSAAASFEVQ